MSTFKALNVEYDEEVDDEPDDTKEVQIEEALKVYQTALKYHSQGRRTLKEAGEAYEELFKSEIFTYTESLSEYKRTELFGQPELDAILEDVPEFEPAVVSTETGPSTLPKILHLSYKNRGQYYLDLLESELENENTEKTQRHRHTAHQALEDFADGIDKDDDDVDLWRRTAKVGGVLGSKRVQRFCLEGALDGDEQETDDVLGMPNIETGVASEDLKKLKGDLQDELSLAQEDAKEELPSIWKNQLKLYPFLPELLPEVWERPESSEDNEPGVVIEVSELSWTLVGQAILDQYRAEQTGVSSSRPGTTLSIKAPEAIDMASQDMNAEKASSGNTATKVINTTMIDEPTSATTEKSVDVEQGQKVSNNLEPASLPVRKRSTDTANLSEGGDGERTTTKRPRTRKSLAAEEGTKNEPSSDYDFQIQSSMQADYWLFGTMNSVVKKLGVEGFGNPEDLRALISPDPVVGAAANDVIDAMPLRQAVQDFYAAIRSWDEGKSNILLKDSATDATEFKLDSADPQHVGLMAFLESSKSGKQQTLSALSLLELHRIIQLLNTAPCATGIAAILWLRGLLCVQDVESRQTSYRACLWEADLKQLIIQTIITLDNELVEAVQEHINTFVDAGNTQIAESGAKVPCASLDVLVLAQTLFELHLDAYSTLTNLESVENIAGRVSQKDRVDLWAELSRELFGIYDDQSQDEGTVALTNELKLRHIWTSVFHLAKSDEVSRDQLVILLGELRKEVLVHGDLTIHLPNSAVTPELSTAAADQELSKLETMDFFLGVFQKDGKVPVDLIDDLEPLLESSISSAALPDNETDNVHSSRDLAVVDDASGVENNRAFASDVLLRFLNQTDVSLRLLLWTRLREAYDAIEYPPKVLSICLRSIEVLTNELKTGGYTRKKQEERQSSLLELLRQCSVLLAKALALIDEYPNAFECVDMTHLRSSFNATADLWNLLYTVALYDDYSTAGGKGGSNVNPFRFYPSEVFHGASVKFHDMQAHTAILLYKLTLEGMTQVPEAFEDSIDDRMTLLRHIHYHWGVRRLCKASDSRFLRFMKDELVMLGQPTKQVSDDLAQVLYDLYDIYTFSSSWEKWEHGCDADYLDRETALQILPFVMKKSEEMSLKDLLKSDLAKTIEKIHAAVGHVKSSTAAIRNRKILNAYLRSPLRPLELFRCVEGICDISAMPISPSEALVASKGWYFLRGQMAITRLRAQRSGGRPVPEDDLQGAVTLFLQDLEYDPERWESWYRLAQAYDAQLEEQVQWSADKLNNDQEELQNMQRAAVHAYAAAVATAMRNLEPSEEAKLKLASLYLDFGTRIYASSRSPFAMRAFSVKDFAVRHFSGSEVGKSHYVLDAYSGMDTLTAWRFASNLFTSAARLRPDYWLNRYMLGKCLWKIHVAYDSIVADHPCIAVQEAFMKSVETLPPIKRADRQEPILEPIYRTIFIAHKLVLREDIKQEAGEEMIRSCLQKQNQFKVPKMPNRSNSTSWSLYMLEVFRVLRAADTQRWHHRLVNRAASVIYRLAETPSEGARLAKDYLVDQHMYNKSYTLTIWKPENERPGRHWVYMTNYASFVAQIFEETNDLEGMAILARRIRKKPSEYYEHTNLWEEICSLHLKLHRRHAKVIDGMADLVFINIDQEEFSTQASLIDAWAISPTTSHPLKVVLRETAELKKLNGGLMKSAAIDDLLGDTYAMIWREIGPKLRPPTIKPEPTTFASTPYMAESMSRPSSLVQQQSTASPPDRRSVMSLTNLMNIDGALDSRPSSFTSAATPTTYSRPVTPPPPPAPASMPTPTQDTTPKPRSRLISRREIIKRASDTVSALKPTASAAAAAKAGSPPPTGREQRSEDTGVTVVADARAEADADGDDNEEDDEDTQDGADKPGLGVGSVTGSVNDDADDESGSELSELEDDEDTVVEERKPMFPNLKARVVEETGPALMGGGREHGGGGQGVEEEMGDASADGPDGVVDGVNTVAGRDGDSVMSER